MYVDNNMFYCNVNGLNVQRCQPKILSADTISLTDRTPDTNSSYLLWAVAKCQ